MDKVGTYGALAYAILSGAALINAGLARAFPKVTAFALFANVLGVVALDVQKLIGLLTGGATKSGPS